MSDIAAVIAILYAARYARRVPESDAERQRTIAAAYDDARLILATLRENMVADEPTQPLPSPGIIGRADVKATRRRG